MNNKQKFAIGIITAVIGSGTTLFAYNNIITTNIEGDTTIINQGDDFLEQAREACKLDVVPEKYEDLCKVFEVIPP